MKLLTTRTLATVALASVIAASLALAPRLKASAWDKLTTLKFNEPVEIPGQVLPAGTYVFKLLDSQSNRNIVQIYNAKQTKLYATILAIPDSRLKPTDKSVITFDERPADSPEAIKAWFYPDDEYGQLFVYPKERAVELAKINSQPVASMPSSLIANTQQPATSSTEPQVVALREAPVKAQQAAGDEVEVADIFVIPTVLTAQAAPPMNTEIPQELPATASPLASIALGGFVMGCLGLMARFAAKRVR